jgi:hypothetical protein
VPLPATKSLPWATDRLVAQPATEPQSPGIGHPADTGSPGGLRGPERRLRWVPTTTRCAEVQGPEEDEGDEGDDGDGGSRLDRGQSPRPPAPSRPPRSRRAARRRGACVQ